MTTIDEWREKYGRGFVVKAQGYSEFNNTQLVYRSELLIKKDGMYEPRKSSLVFIIQGLPRVMSQSLQTTLAYIAQGKALSLPEGVEYDVAAERFKVHIDLLTLDTGKTGAMTNLNAPDATVVAESLNIQPIFEIDTPSQTFDEDTYFGRILKQVSDNFKSKPSIVEDFEFIGSLIRLDVNSLHVDPKVDLINEEGLAKFITTALIIYKIKQNEKNN